LAVPEKNRAAALAAVSAASQTRQMRVVDASAAGRKMGAGRGQGEGFRGASGQKRKTGKAKFDRLGRKLLTPEFSVVMDRTGYGLLSSMTCAHAQDRFDINPLRRTTMPTYHIEMFEGRTPEQKKKLVAEITRVTVEVLGGSAESVDIIITDIKRENWSTGGRLWSEPRS
jgi:4-oxalocrotonate tautomerase